MLVLELPSEFSALAPASAQVRSHLAESGAPDAASFLAELVIEELVTNTIKYGYDTPGPHRIQVSVVFSAAKLTITVRDDGHPFDPLAQPAPDTTLEAEERGIGGLGIHLVRQMSDEVRYERRGESNVVTVTKRFDADPSASRQ